VEKLRKASAAPARHTHTATPPPTPSRLTTIGGRASSTSNKPKAAWSVRIHLIDLCDFVVWPVRVRTHSGFP
jgi:hypothetical protein